MSGSGIAGNGVKVSKITEDDSDFNLVYDPTDPDANADGYVQKPNVDPLKEMVDLVSMAIVYLICCILSVLSILNLKRRNCINHIHSPTFRFLTPSSAFPLWHSSP